jgi:hypothetical protein
MLCLPATTLYISCLLQLLVASFSLVLNLISLFVSGARNKRLYNTQHTHSHSLSLSLSIYIYMELGVEQAVLSRFV